MLYATEKHRAVTAILLVFMFIFAELIVADNEYEIVDEDKPNFTLTQSAIIAETYISSQFSSDNFLSSTHNSVGVDNLGNENRSMYRFSNSFSSQTDVIESAELVITCDVVYQDNTGVIPKLYPATIVSNIAPSEVTWNEIADDISWQQPGADGQNDRTAWEPPSQSQLMSGATYEYTFNVTKLAQTSLDLSRTKFDILVSGIGGLVNCAKQSNTTSAYHPVLSITHTSGVHGDGGSVNANFAQDGMPLMTDSFISVADVSPEIGYEQLVGSGVEFQFSNSVDFRDIADLNWIYSTMSSAFTSTGASGDYTIPINDAFPLGSIIHYRYRSFDSTSKLSDWSAGNFLLPSYSITNNNDGTATLSLTNDDFTLEDSNLIEDTYVDYSNPTTNYGQDAYLSIDTSSTSKSIIHLKVNMHLLGLPDNSTIVDAKLDLQRNSNSISSTNLSIHQNTEQSWNEDTITWNYGSIGTPWQNGGINGILTSQDSEINTAKTDNIFTFDIVDSIQDALLNLDSNGVQYSVIGYAPNQALSSIGESITFAASNYQNQNGQLAKPTLNITYSWSANSSAIVPGLISPVNGEPVWNNSNGNISGNTIPNLLWNSQDNSPQNTIFQLSTDQYFRTIIAESDTRGQSQPSSSGNWTTSLTDSLNKGATYYWRVKNIDNDGLHSKWNETNFFISSASSTWLGGDLHKLVIYQSLEPGNPDLPDFSYSTISSSAPTTNSYGYPYLNIASTNSAKFNSLLGLDITNYLLPDGYAVTSSYLSLNARSHSSAPVIGVWELSNHDWDEQEVTWLESSLNTPWDGSGASGLADRTNLLDSQTISNNGIHTWNITSATQDAMRAQERLDLMIEVLPGQIGVDAIFSSPNDPQSNLQPQIEFIYTSGSNQKPLPPSVESPNNGEWVFTNNSSLEANISPLLSWNSTSNVGIIGWVLELDNSEGFNSPNRRIASSWNDVGFNNTNQTYTLQSDLEVGYKWFWRVKALSSTYQLGEWSSKFHFYLPNLSFNQLNPNTFTTQYHNNSVVSNDNLITFLDASISDAFSLVPPILYDPFLLVGTTNTGDNYSSLISIPIPVEMHPRNASLISANLNLQSSPLSTTDIPIALREVLKPWDHNVTNTKYNSTDNWTMLGGRAIDSDIGSPLDIQTSTNGIMTWNLTQLVQQAISEGKTSVSVMLYADQNNLGDLVYFDSSDSTVNKPSLNLTWAEGSRPVPTINPIYTSPTPGQIYFNQTSHAIIPELRPVFTWQLPTSTTQPPDAWRIYFDFNSTDDMAGSVFYDSRINPGLFDLIHYTFQPDININFDTTIQWYLQPINNHMMGQIHGKSTYLIPNNLGQIINQTDAIITIQQGSILPQINYPQLTQDVYLDEGDSANSQNGKGLVVGNSTTAGNNLSSTTSLISFDLSVLSLPTTYEVLSAELVMTAVNGYGDVDISASKMLSDWDESSTWDNNSSTSQWNNLGALRGTDSELPDSLVNVNQLGEYRWNVTRIVQSSLAAGNSVSSIILQPEIINYPSGIINGNYEFADSENSSIELRPKLELTYRTTQQWLPPAFSQSSPIDGSTIWNTSSALITGPESIEFAVSNLANNITDWSICHGSQIRWLDCHSSFEINSDFIFNTATGTITYVNSSSISDDMGDSWNYWRVRGDQEHRIGHYSDISKYRHTDQQTTQNGDNITINLSRSSIFENTGEMPRVIDSFTNDLITGQNNGLNSTLRLGFDPGTGSTNQMYFQYNLSDIYFTPTSMPTSAIFQLESSSSLVGINPMIVSVYECESFDELSISYAASPICSSNEETRTTIFAGTNQNLQWDITSIVQQSFINNNDTFSFKISADSSTTNFIEVYSSDNNGNTMPSLLLTYLENINGYTPPSQPTLISPIDGEILYDTTNPIITNPQSVQLQWSPAIGADNYKLYISNQSSTVIYDSRQDSEITGTSFSSSNFAVGEVYQWWVQGLNQTIPGPSSQIWAFATSNPQHIYQDDGTYSYQVIDSYEVPDYSHVNSLDATITDASPDSNFGGLDSLVIGSGCENVAGSQCYAIISLDTSQLPINNSQTIHSVSLKLLIDAWDLSGGAYGVEFSVHQLLLNNWNEYGLTWNTTGSTPGPIPGVDYVSNPLDVITLFSSDYKLEFDIATDALAIGDDIQLIIKGTPLSTGGNFDGFAKFYSNEFINYQQRPTWVISHTNVSSLNITSNSGTFDSDGTYTFDLQGFDSNGVVIPGNMPAGAQIEWFTTTGSIVNVGPTSADLSPSVNGLQTITACYGVICTDYIVDVESGLPVQIFASLSQNSDVNSITITADETVTVSAYAVDQHGNLVTNEIINFIVSNGSISSSNVFSPYTVGSQTVTAEWVGLTTSLQEVLQVEVTPGTPTQVTMSGCEQIINANTSCFLYGSAYDQFGNTVWFDDVVSFDLTPEDGEITIIQTPTPHDAPPLEDVLIGEFTGNLVGTWEVGLSTEANLLGSVFVEVTHGEIGGFELSASNETITADEFLFINSTRIDVRGNRLAVNLATENWTSIADGSITSGLTSTWEPTLQGSKSLSASYQGFSDTLNVFVLRGALYDLQIIINDEVSQTEAYSITADDEISASLLAFDAKGNQWLVDGEWSLYHPNFLDQSVLSSNFSQEVTFSPTLASSSPYAISVEHQENDVILSSNFVVYVSVGDIENFIVSAFDSNGNQYSVQDGFSVTADDYIQFQFSTSDFDLNIIDDAGELWILQNLADNSVIDITQLMNQNSLLWNPDLVGDYLISVYTINQRGFNLSSQFNVDVDHGTPVSLEITQSATTQNAGDIVNLQVTGTDSDGNQFAQPVVWFENNAQANNINSTGNDGAYEFNGRTAGNYTLAAEYLTVSSTTYIEVFSLNIAANIKYNVSTDALEQLEKLTVTVEVYDEYWNRISVPQNARVDTTDRGDVTYLGDGVWELETLDEGAHSATIVVGSITETFTYDVEGNLAGFFAAGGPLYYVAAGLIGLIVMALLVFLVRLVRGDGEYYDEDDEDDYSDDEDAKPAKDFTKTTISNTPVVPTPPTSPPKQPEEVAEEPENSADEDLSWAVDYRIEDDGTEWGQTDDDIWYYRESGSDDWVEWTE